jgi:hypothetical protein
VGAEREFEKVKLFSGAIFRDIDIYRVAKKRLASEISAVDSESQRFDFNATTYYHEEMGQPLFRVFMSFSVLVEPQMLVEIKRLTNRVEKEFSLQGLRRINLDPGYVSLANVIIATTKNHYHRIPLAGGIYAHLEYVVKKGGMHPLEWTYPDFRNPSYIRFFEELRESYKRDLRLLHTRRD